MHIVRIFSDHERIDRDDRNWDSDYWVIFVLKVTKYKIVGIKLSLSTCPNFSFVLSNKKPKNQLKFKNPNTLVEINWQIIINNVFSKELDDLVTEDFFTYMETRYKTDEVQKINELRTAMYRDEYQFKG